MGKSFDGISTGSRRGRALASLVLSVFLTACAVAPGMRMTDKDREACAEIARQHIRLAKPQRLLLFGDGPCLALLGKRLVEARGHVHKIEGVRAVATFHPRHLINRPLDKHLAWRDLLLLMEDEA